MAVRNVESILFHNTYLFLKKFVENKNVSLKENYKLSVKNKPIDVNDSISTHLYFSTCLFSFELLALVTENFNQTSLNFGDPAINTLLREAKKSLPEEYKNMNSEELLKLIRDSIAHNSATIQNRYTNNLNQHEITLNKKKVTPAKYKLSLQDILVLSEAYDKARVMSHVHATITHEDDITSIKDLLQKRKKLGSFDKFLTFYNEKGEAVPIDKYQDAAYLRFLLKHSTLINTSKNIDHYISRYFPAKDNKLNNYEHKCQLSMICATLLDFSNDKIVDSTIKQYTTKLKPDKFKSMTYYNIKCNDIIEMMKKINMQGVLPCADKEFLSSIFLSSIAFSIFSNRTNNELYDLYKESGHEMDLDTVRHIRNAFMHGRYYYNFNGAFEIYDGHKELEHITTLNMNIIEDLYKKYAQKEISEIIKVRAKYDALSVEYSDDVNLILKQKNNSNSNEM